MCLCVSIDGIVRMVYMRKDMALVDRSNIFSLFHRKSAAKAIVNGMTSFLSGISENHDAISAFLYV